MSMILDHDHFLTVSTQTDRLFIKSVAHARTHTYPSVFGSLYETSLDLQHKSVDRMIFLQNGLVARVTFIEFDESKTAI